MKAGGAFRVFFRGFREGLMEAAIQTGDRRLFLCFLGCSEAKF